MLDSPFTPPEYLSPSSISTWQQCPLKFKYNKIDGIVDPPTDATLLGNFVHDVLEALFDFPAQDRTLINARQTMRSIWDTKYCVLAEETVGRDAQTLHEFRWKAWWCIENYFQLEDPSTVEFDGLEEYVTGTIASARMRGFIDRWHKTPEGIVIGDYKTGKVPAPKWREGKFQQLIIYAYLLEQIHDLPVLRLELLYLKNGTKITRSVSNEDLDAVENTISEVNVQLKAACETGYFPFVKQKLCNWCSYKNICPAWNKQTIEKDM